MSAIRGWVKARGYGDVWDPRDGSRRIGSPDPEDARFVAARGVCLLWALALEIDERAATRTGEQVCRACGGRGEASEWAYTVEWWEQPHSTRQGQVSETTRCPCDGPTRPDTIALHRLVADLANLPHPRFEWPESWQVALDELQANGLDWIGRWWLAFAEWTWRGKLPDADALAADLDALLPELEARERAKRAALARRAELLGVVGNFLAEQAGIGSIGQVRAAVMAVEGVESCVVALTNRDGEIVVTWSGIRRVQTQVMARAREAAPAGTSVWVQTPTDAAAGVAPILVPMETVVLHVERPILYVNGELIDVLSVECKTEITAWGTGLVVTAIAGAEPLWIGDIEGWVGVDVRVVSGSSEFFGRVETARVDWDAGTREADHRLGETEVRYDHAAMPPSWTVTMQAPNGAERVVAQW